MVKVAPDPLESTLLLEFNVAELVIDEPASRTLEGEDFRSRISEKAIAGTRTNLLGRKLLQAEQFSTIRAALTLFRECAFAVVDDGDVACPDETAE